MWLRFERCGTEMNKEDIARIMISSAFIVEL